MAGRCFSCEPAGGSALTRPTRDEEKRIGLGGVLLIPRGSRQQGLQDQRKRTVTVLKAGEQGEILAVNDLSEEVWATPAIAKAAAETRPSYFDDTCRYTE